MTRFYEGLEHRLPKDEALHAAQLHLRRAPTVLDEEPEESFWRRLPASTGWRESDPAATVLDATHPTGPTSRLIGEPVLVR